jgi:putative transcription factor
MMCEICGKPIKGKGREIFVESAKLTVCKNCARYGTAVKKKPQKSTQKRVFHSKKADFEIREDYPSVVKQAREKTRKSQ